MIETDEEYLSYNAYISNIEKINIRSEPYMLGMQYVYHESDGTHLYITISFKDIAQKEIVIDEKEFLLPPYIRFDVYQQVMLLLEKKRMSAQIYDALRKHSNTRGQIAIKVLEETFLEKEGSTVEIIYVLPIMVNGQFISGKQRINLVYI